MRAVTFVLFGISVLLQSAWTLPIIGSYGSHTLDSVQAGVTHRELHVAVKQSNEGLLLDLLNLVSDPHSSKYGQHLSLDDVCAQFGPEKASIEAVLQWAEKHGAEDIRHTRCNDFITLRLPTRALKQAFAGAKGLQCDDEAGCNRAIAVPLALANFVDFVDGLGGGVKVGPKKDNMRDYSPESRRKTAGVMDAPKYEAGVGKTGPWYPKCLATSAIPPCLRQLHNVTVHKGKSEKSSQGVALFGYQYYSPSDLQQFQTEYKVPPSTVLDLNDNDPSTPGNEASLDVQYISAMGAGIQPWYMHYKCTTQECHPFLTWIQQIGNTTNPPLVQSVSVGTTEYEYVGDYGEKYVERINQEFMKAGVRGITLLFATGDRATQIFEKKYWINFPSASPYVTAVGGVWLGELGGGPLEVDPDTTGGFSNCEVHARPKYQDTAVENYLKEAASEKAKQPPYFNATNRGVPDLVSMSDAFVIIQHGSETFIGGTSAACPVVAGVISLVNDARLAAGKSALGFVNPMLYANPQCFEDIVGGENAYGATEGWDPASGLGLPVFSCLLKAAMSHI